MARVPMACLDCGVLTTSGSRCVRCTTTREAARNAQPHRQAYKDPVYRSIVPSGMCHWCKVRPATQKDHKVRLIHNGANNAANIVFACAYCNATNAGRTKSSKV